MDLLTKCLNSYFQKRNSWTVMFLYYLLKSPSLKNESGEYKSMNFSHNWRTFCGNIFYIYLSQVCCYWNALKGKLLMKLHDTGKRLASVFLHLHLTLLYKKDLRAKKNLKCIWAFILGIIGLNQIFWGHYRRKEGLNKSHKFLWASLASYR